MTHRKISKLLMVALGAIIFLTGCGNSKTNTQPLPPTAYPPQGQAPYGQQYGQYGQPPVGQQYGQYGQPPVGQQYGYGQPPMGQQYGPQYGYQSPYGNGYAPSPYGNGYAYAPSPYGYGPTNPYGSPYGYGAPNPYQGYGGGAAPVPVMVPGYPGMGYGV